MSGFKRKLRFVPSLLTCSSAFCRMLSTFLAMEGDKSLVWAAYLILLAAVFDFSDGFAARLLDACSELGKQLDSLADAISFGVAPSAILFQILKQSMRLRGGIFTFQPWEIAVLLCSILVAVFAILRLAKFNIDPDQAHSFKGLASPACAMFMASIPLIDAAVPEDMLITKILDTCGTEIEFKWEMILIGLQVFGLGKWYILPFLWAVVPLFNFFFFARVPLRVLVEESERVPLKKLSLLGSGRSCAETVRLE